jgi:polysaccharide export outer membrane protein
VKAASLALFVVVGAGAGACHHQLPLYDYTKEPDPRNREIVLGVGDVLKITVYDNNPLNTEVIIRPDGTITMSLVGDIKAAGETPSALRNHITERLADFVKLTGPAVQVAVQSWHSYRFRIDGEVVKPGVYQSDHYVTVADAIAQAGGPTRFAHRDQMKIQRTDPKSHVVHQIPLDYDLLTSGKRNDMNIYVLADDAINIP